MNHIREKLPDMKAKLNTLMGQTQQELNSFGDSNFFGKPHRASLILKLMTQFGRDFVSSIDGTSLEISTKELSGGARIYYIFNDVFGRALESINPNHNLSNHDIRTAIRNSTGPRPSLFVPEVAFELLIKPQINLLEPPSIRCVELVYEELMKICHNCTSPELQRFPRLHAQLIEVVSDLLRERLGPTSEYVQSLISIQSAYINTNHPSFAAGTAAYANEAQQERNQKKVTISDQINGINNNNNDMDGVDDKALTAIERPINSFTPESDSALYNSSFNHGRRRGHQHTHSQSQSQSQSQTARDTFLNYFFGGADAASGSNNNTTSNANAPRTPIRDIDAEHKHNSNPLNGRMGLEGSAAAYDMKSLGKHLEPVPTVEEGGSAVSEREEMETTLIRSLIASYFSIVRQTIEDLVPKVRNSYFIKIFQLIQFDK